MNFNQGFDPQLLKVALDRAIQELQVDIFSRALRIGIDPYNLDLDWTPSDPEDTNQTNLKKSLESYKLACQRKAEL